MFIKFDKFIEMFADEEYPSDYWSDVAILNASEMLDGFSDADWLELLTVVGSKSNFWILRLCETLGDPDERALVVLLKVTSRQASQAIYVALESIRSMISLGLDVSAYADEINAATERARQTTGKVSLRSTL